MMPKLALKIALSFQSWKMRAQSLLTQPPPPVGPRFYAEYAELRQLLKQTGFKLTPLGKKNYRVVKASLEQRLQSMALQIEESPIGVIEKSIYELAQRLANLQQKAEAATPANYQSLQADYLARERLLKDFILEYQTNPLELPAKEIKELQARAQTLQLTLQGIKENLYKLNPTLSHLISPNMQTELLDLIHAVQDEALRYVLENTWRAKQDFYACYSLEEVKQAFASINFYLAQTAPAALSYSGLLEYLHQKNAAIFPLNREDFAELLASKQAQSLSEQLRQTDQQSLAGEPTRFSAQTGSSPSDQPEQPSFNLTTSQKASQRSWRDTLARISANLVAR